MENESVPAIVEERLAEYCDSRGQAMRVDRAAGVIRGVKILGLSSRNGRTYRPGALREASALYEGAKVNVNHPKGSPAAPRDYQDRLGSVRGVTWREAEGLFADLHFNPRHPLAEQLSWDAEHAPENVGFSHNVLARTSRAQGETVVEAILSVQSVDLVADPATTRGLYEVADASARNSGVERPLAEWTTEELLATCAKRARRRGARSWPRREPRRPWPGKPRGARHGESWPSECWPSTVYPAR
jgi:hypothetical protein